MTKLNRRMKIATKMGKRIYKKMYYTELMIRKANLKQFLGMSTEKGGLKLFSLGRSLNGAGEFCIEGLTQRDLGPAVFRDVIHIIDDDRSIGQIFRRTHKDREGLEWELEIQVTGNRNGRNAKLYELPRRLLGEERFWDMIHYSAKVYHMNDPRVIDNYWDLERHPSYKDNSDGSFASLIGKTLVKIEGMEPESDFVEMIDSEGNKYHFYHSQCCCESVDIADVVGDPKDLIGHPITMAEVVSSEDEGFSIPEEAKEHSDGCESFTWTFYKLATVKGYVDVRWLGRSNGYYGEEVNFVKIPASVAQHVKGQLQ